MQIMKSLHPCSQGSNARMIAQGSVVPDMTGHGSSGRMIGCLEKTVKFGVCALLLDITACVLTA